MPDKSDTLYHYTSQDGLLGIFTSRCIRATNINYLNDHMEVMHAINLATSIISDIAKKNPIFRGKGFSKLFKDTIKTLPRVNIFVASFSEEDDLLSQWRGYCSDGPGFSIGFNKNVLNEIENSYGLRLVKVEYDLNKQKKILKQEIDNIINDSLVNKTINTLFRDDLKPIVYSIYMKTFSIAPTFKDKSYSEEREWRLISMPLDYLDERIAFRKGKSYLVPYIEIKLEKILNPLNARPYVPVSKIIIGPTLDKTYVKLAVDDFLFLLRVNNCEIKTSKIPYRNW